MDGTLTCSIPLDQSGPGSNGNKGVLHTPQNLSFTTRFSLVLYTENHFIRWVIPLQLEVQSTYFKQDIKTQQRSYTKKTHLAKSRLNTLFS